MASKARYNQLYKVIKFNKPESIVEVGTWTGERALQLIQWALKYKPYVKYYGFDLFEDATDETDSAEFNGKKFHPSAQSVAEMLQTAKDGGLNFDFELHKGNTRESLYAGGPWTIADLAFIDGGHSVETIKSDYEALKACRTIVFDDYYTPDKQGVGPNTQEVGCNSLIDSLSNCVILPTGDMQEGFGAIFMVITPIQANPFPVNFDVKTRNCVEDTVIQDNIRYSRSFVKKLIPLCKKHDRTAVLVAGGPKMHEHIDEIRELSMDLDHEIFCVKTSYKPLVIDYGIIPFACVLLDPRDHVQLHITPIRNDIRFLVASMCHPTTVDLLTEAEANVYFYHALVGANEQEVVKELYKDFQNMPVQNMVCGGSTAAMRSMLIAHMMGFCKFKLYGYDSCYWTEQNMDHKDSLGQPYFWRVNINGRAFLTNLQLYAQAQEFGRLISELIMTRAFDIEVCSDGMFKHIYDTQWKSLPDFQDVMFPVQEDFLSLMKVEELNGDENAPS